MRHAALLLLGLGLLLPAPVEGQSVYCGAVTMTCQTTVSLEVVPPQDPIMPNGSFVALPVKVTYTFVDAEPMLSATPIELKVTELPPWGLATVSPSVVYVAASGSPCLCTRTVVADAFLLLSVTHDAPAFVQGIVEVRAVAEPNGGHMGSTAKNAIPFTADFFALTNARALPETLAVAPGAAKDLRLQVSNGGNGQVRLAFTVEHAPKGVRASPPSSVVLQSRQQGGKLTDTVLGWRVETDPGFQPGDVVLGVHSSYALDGRVRGDDVLVTMPVARGRDGDAVVVESLLGSGGTAMLPLELGLVSAAAALGVLVELRRRRGGG
jgi:hypothetical protein